MAATYIVLKTEGLAEQGKSFVKVVAFRKAVCKKSSDELRPSPHGCGEPAGCPWA